MVGGSARVFGVVLKLRKSKFVAGKLAPSGAALSPTGPLELEGGFDHPLDIPTQSLNALHLESDDRLSVATTHSTYSSQYTFSLASLSTLS